jgi:heme-degrading monooxygenase HmoA
MPTAVRRDEPTPLPRENSNASGTAPTGQSVIFAIARRYSMPEIREDNGVVTQITTVKLPPDNQDEVIELMTERARFMATQPGFVSIALHRSTDGSHVVNYIQWANREKLEKAHHSPEFRKKWPQLGDLAEEIDPHLYQVIHVEAA